MKRPALTCCMALVAVLFLGFNTHAALTNGGFEDDDASGGDVPGASGWSGFNANFTTAAVSRTGSQSLKVFGPFVQDGGAGVTQKVPASPGETFVGEVWALNASFDAIDDMDFGVYKIEFLDAGMNLVSGGLLGVDIFESNQIDGTAPLDQWQLLGVGTAPAPAGTAFAQAVLVKVDVDGAQGGSIFWDDASLGSVQIPEPTALGLFGLTLTGLATVRRRR